MRDGRCGNIRDQPVPSWSGSHSVSSQLLMKSGRGFAVHLQRIAQHAVPVLLVVAE